MGRGGHNPPGRAWGAWRAQVGCAQLVAPLWCLLAPIFLKPRRAQVGCAHLVAPLWCLLAPIFLKQSIKNLCEVSAHLDLCRIGIFDVAFSGPEFQLPVISLIVCTLHIMREKTLEILQKALLYIKTI